DQSRHVDGGDNVTDIRLLNHSQVMGRRARARREAAQVDPPLNVLMIHPFFDVGVVVIPLAPTHPRLMRPPAISFWWSDDRPNGDKRLRSLRVGRSKQNAQTAHRLQAE